MCGHAGAAATLTSNEASYGAVDCTKSSTGTAQSSASDQGSTCEVTATTGYSTGTITCETIHTIVISTSLEFVVDPTLFQLASKVPLRG